MDQCNEKKSENLECLSDPRGQWNENVPILYDLLVSKKLEGPTRTVQWLNDEVQKEEEYDIQRVIFANRKSSDNCLTVGAIKLPSVNGEVRLPYEKSLSDTGFESVKDKIAIEKIIVHPKGPVLIARPMPQNTAVKTRFVATRTSTNDVYVIDFSINSKINCQPASYPHIRLEGHNREGYGLSWNTILKGCLLTSAYDGQIFIFDIQDKPKENGAVGPSWSYTATHSNVLDVKWNFIDGYMFASAENKNLTTWDMRCPSAAGTVHTHHEDKVTCLAFNPFLQEQVATGSADKTVAVWDLRYTQKKLGSVSHSFQWHEGAVTQIQWSAKHKQILSSSDIDGRIHIWDLSKVGKAQSIQEAEDGPPELIFVHAGHRMHVNDFSWNPKRDWTLASVSEDNVLQIWQVADYIVNE